MGQPAGLATWALRATFVALIGIGATVGLTARPADHGRGALLSARAVMERAGFTVARTTGGSWLNGAIKGEAHLVARSPICAQPVEVVAVPITDRFVTAELGTDPLYIFGDWRGSRPSRLRLAVVAARMQLHYALTLGRHGRPSPGMLEISDPSACLAILAPDWRSVWYG